MQDLIKMVADKTGISEPQAKTAVNMVVSYLKNKMPDVGGQMDSLMKGKSGSVEDLADGLKDKVGNMFGK